MFRVPRFIAHSCLSTPSRAVDSCTILHLLSKYFLSLPRHCYFPSHVTSRGYYVNMYIGGLTTCTKIATGIGLDCMSESLSFFFSPCSFVNGATFSPHSTSILTFASPEVQPTDTQFVCKFFFPPSTALAPFLR